ncbi:MAG: HDOD domain-containing protein [Candidatus Sedimenticola sp. (ex Thyasira tokunagai)]
MSSEDNRKFDIKAFAIGLREDIDQNRVKLPTLPTISLEALLVVNDADSSMADVAKIISKDTAMAARLVRYANSPLYQGVSTVSSVKGAITRIGFDAVKHAILSLAMRDVFTTAFKSIRERMETLWKHSVSVAAKSAVLAGHFHHLNSDEAMLAGLIHDVGVIPILLKAKNHEVLLEKESYLDKVIDLLHMSTGKFMLSHWNFDPVMIEVAGNCDRLDRELKGSEVDYVDIVQVANILSYKGSHRQYDKLVLENVPAAKRIGLELIRRMQEEMERNEEEMALSAMLH